MNMKGVGVIMKIIVDEMPAYQDECLFSRMVDGDWVCGKYEWCKCDINACDLLKPLSEAIPVIVDGTTTVISIKNK